MSHGMSNIPTFRRGRSYFVGDYKGGACQGYCGLFIFIVATIAVNYSIFYNQSYYYTVANTFDGIKSEIVELDVDSVGSINELTRTKTPPIVHFSSKDVHSSVYEPDFNFEARGSVKLIRHTEYCQWTETAHDKCDVCHRNVRQEDGKMKSESYSCNCVRYYNYIKSWRSHRINSLFFNQPAAHHNPQRDPFPSSTLQSRNAYVGNSFPLTDELINNIKGTAQWLIWDRGLAVKDLSGLYDSSAFKLHHFTYVGNGYFFSPYESSNQEWLAKKFFQWIEGSLLDYQLGDLMPSCVAGDIRVWYTTISPTQLSGIGQVSLSADGTAGWIGVHNLLNGNSVGLLREGSLTALELMSLELWDIKKIVLICRLLLLIWSLAVTGLLKAYCGCLVDVGYLVYILNSLSITSFINFLAMSHSVLTSAQNAGGAYSAPMSQGDNLTSSLGIGVSVVLFLITTMRISALGNSRFGGLGASKRLLLKWCGGPIEWYEAPSNTAVEK